MPIQIPFDNSYARLPQRFYARINPTQVASPRLVRVNGHLAGQLGIDLGGLSEADLANIFAGNLVPAGAEPIALAYAGHQFGGFSPQLGDGRAVLLGEVVGLDGKRRDIQLKGAGPTPFSRQGDGRAALGPVLREYIISEAMAALGIPTTRALAAVTTGEDVFRETRLPGAVLTRVAASHIRVGTFQFFAARGDTEAVKTLADHVIARHYPDAAGADNAYRALLDGVIGRQAELVAQWALVGFIHGVMNTDNTAISGETIDYGPCAFMDAYDPAAVFSSIDQGGRYAYANQPRIAHWNLSRFAETLLPLLGVSDDAGIASAEAALEAFGPCFESAYLGGLRRKIGLTTQREGDSDLVRELLARMASSAADFTLTFRNLCAAAAPEGDADMRALFTDGDANDEWAARWRARLALEPTSPLVRAAAMRGLNPAIIPRNHVVEAALAAALGGDLGPFEALLEATARPFEDRPGFEAFTLPPAQVDPSYQTFCGT